MPARLDRQAGTAVDNNLLARTHMEMPARLKVLIVYPDRLITVHSQVVARPLRLIATNHDVALIAHLHMLIVEHVLIPVPLSSQIDLFSALAVLDSHFVVATATRTGLAAKNTAGLVRWQIQRHRIGRIRHATHYQRFVRVGINEPHQHFHAYPRDHHAAVSVVRPTRGHAQPAAGMFIELTFTVPGELYLDPAKRITVDFAVLGSRHHGGLVAEHARLFWTQWRAKQHVPRRRQKGVLIAFKIIRIVGRR